jgi:RNA-directed DNA polymerase
VGIPVLLDRAEQCLAKQALEPQWESRFEGDSYGFRPGRSCHDALEAIHKAICHQPKYVLDADIAGCFDHIDQQALLTKLDSIPAIRQAVKGWLRAGVLDGDVLTPTTNGTPQGGVASPLLANIALQGMEAVARQAYTGRTAYGAPIRPSLIRYADDFVIVCTDLAGIQAAQAAVAAWLAGLGLHLSPTKTHLTHTLTPVEGRVGFDFLGCTIRQFPAGKTRSGKRSNGTLLGFRTRITPSKQAVSRHLATTRASIRRHRTAPQAALIADLNPRISGWAAYYRCVSASRVYALCEHRLFAQLWHWARRRHPRAGRHAVARRYWLLQPGARWVFVVREAGEITAQLRTHHTPSVATSRCGGRPVRMTATWSTGHGVCVSIRSPAPRSVASLPLSTAHVLAVVYSFVIQTCWKSTMSCRPARAAASTIPTSKSCIAIATTKRPWTTSMVGFHCQRPPDRGAG